jgi:hypothetical protein
MDFELSAHVDLWSAHQRENASSRLKLSLIYFLLVATGKIADAGLCKTRTNRQFLDVAFNVLAPFFEPQDPGGRYWR